MLLLKLGVAWKKRDVIVQYLVWQFLKPNIPTSYCLQVLICSPSLLCCISMALPKIASCVPSLPFAISKTKIATPVGFLANDWAGAGGGNQIELMPNALISPSLDKNQRSGEHSSPTESKSLGHFSSPLRLTERMTTH